MDDYKPVGTTMETSYKLSKFIELTNVDHTLYRSMIGSLLYLTTTRPNIM